MPLFLILREVSIVDKVAMYRKQIEKTAALNSNIQLRDYQQRAVNRDGDSVIMAHPVGSGKTLASIARFERLKQKGKAHKALVIVPASLRNNYATNGIAKFTDSSYNVIGNKQEMSSKGSPYHGVDPNKDYNIISYEMFRKNPKYFLSSTGADTVIFDESHRAKNHESMTFNSLKNTRPMYKNMIGLTGSLTSNSVYDVVPLLDIATGGKDNLTKKIPQLEKRYVVRDNDKRYKDVPNSKRPIKGFKNTRELRSKLLKYIDYLSPKAIKRSANIPDKRVNYINVPMSQEQARIYKGMLKRDPEVLKMIVDRRYETMNDMEMAKAYNKMIEMRKLMNSVRSVEPGVTQEQNLQMSPKLRTLLQNVNTDLHTDPRNQEIITSFLRKGGTDDIEPYLKQMHIRYGKFVGKDADLTEEMRNKSVQDYLAHKNRVLLISGAGGEGLDLPNTSHVAMLDQHYNPERNNQMMSRAIRSNGLADRPKNERVVTVNKYMSVMPKEFFGLKKSKYKTPDEVIQAIANRKQHDNDKFNNLLAGGQYNG
jgi:SNF2 family DNA or RNA helicase